MVWAWFVSVPQWEGEEGQGENPVPCPCVRMVHRSARRPKPRQILQWVSGSPCPEGPPGAG